MASAFTIHQSTVGKKALVAVTGLVLFGFLVGHLAGNLLVLGGYETFNNYAHTLKSNLPLLWGARITLLIAVLVHIAATLSLAGRNAAARPTGYQRPRTDQVTTYAARTMVISGPLLLAYIIFHLAHFTVPGLDIGGEFSAINAYGNFIRGFREPWVTGIYVFATLMLGLHLFHGGASALQSIGASHARYNPLRQKAAMGLALLITAGNLSLPLLVLTRVIGSDAELALADAHPLGPDSEADAEAEPEPVPADEWE